MRSLKTGFAVAVAILVSLGVADAQHVVKVKYGPFARPLTSLPGATVDNYQTLDPQVKAGFKGSIIDTSDDQAHGRYEPDIKMVTSH
jgi:hypothetical protein